MGFEVEVTAGNSLRYYDISGDNHQALERVFLSHCHAKSLSVTVHASGGKAKQLHLVNLSALRCLKQLEYMNMKMNNAATFICDTPFLFQLKHLSLTRCQMTHYDFGILMNCVSDTLVSLELIRTSLMDVQCSANTETTLNELHRLSNLKSLKLDKTWLELKDLSTHFIFTRLESLMILKVDFEDLFSTALRRMNCTVVSQILTVDGKDYGVGDVDSLQGKFHQFAAKSYSLMKFGDKKRKLSRRSTDEEKIDAKTEFRFVLGWPAFEPDDTYDEVKSQLKEVFAFESLKVFIPRKSKKGFNSPASTPALSPVSSSEEEAEETFVTAFETLPEISAAS